MSRPIELLELAADALEDGRDPFDHALDCPVMLAQPETPHV